MRRDSLGGDPIPEDRVRLDRIHIETLARERDGEAPVPGPEIENSSLLARPIEKSIEDVPVVPDRFIHHVDQLRRLE